MISENDMENAICQNPEKYLGEKGISEVGGKYSLNLPAPAAVPKPVIF
jgi:hypothetical protein